MAIDPDEYLIRPLLRRALALGGAIGVAWGIAAAISVLLFISSEPVSHVLSSKAGPIDEAYERDMKALWAPYGEAVFDAVTVCAIGSFITGFLACRKMLPQASDDHRFMGAAAALGVTLVVAVATVLLRGGRW